MRTCLQMPLAPPSNSLHSGQPLGLPYLNGCPCQTTCATPQQCSTWTRLCTASLGDGGTSCSGSSSLGHHHLASRSAVHAAYCTLPCELNLCCGDSSSSLSEGNLGACGAGVLGLRRMSAAAAARSMACQAALLAPALRALLCARNPNDFVAKDDHNTASRGPPAAAAVQ